MKIEIESEEVLELLTGLNNGLFEKVRYIAEGYAEKLKEQPGEKEKL